MKIICAWCKKIIKDGQGGISHGICPNCERNFNKQLSKAKGGKKINA